MKMYKFDDKTKSEMLEKECISESIGKNISYDALTDLPDMKYFLILAQEAAREITLKGKIPVMLSFQLDAINAFNKNTSIRVGEKLIISVGEILKKYFSQKAVTRYSEDQFFAYDEKDAIEFKLFNIFEEVKKLGMGRNFPIRVGIYYSENRKEAVSPSVACDRAKMAANKNKGVFESKFFYYTKQMEIAQKERDYILNNIDKAIENGCIKAYYQPKIRTVDDKLCGAEVLARWDDSDYGFLSPSSFIPVLEESGLTYKLDTFIIKQVAKDLAKCDELGIEKVPISFNLSATDFQVINPLDILEKVVADTKQPKKYFRVEITESMVIADPSHMKKSLDDIRKAGYEVIMDDFGSGYSSLSILKEYELDEIKIDTSFLKNFDHKSREIIKSIVSMAKNLGMKTIVEGVDNKEHYAFFKEIGCDMIQGYYYGKPVTFEEFSGKLNKVCFHDENDKEDLKNQFKICNENDFSKESACQDIQDFLLKEMDTKKSAVNLEDVLNVYKNLPVGISIVKMILDKSNKKVEDVKFLYANKRYCTGVNKSLLDIIEKKSSELFSKEENKILYKLCQKALDKGAEIKGNKFSKKVNSFLNYVIAPVLAPDCYVIICNYSKGSNLEEDFLRKNDESDDIVIRIAKLLSIDGDYKKIMNRVLEELSLIIHSDRLHILEYDQSHNVTAFEWCKKGLQSVRGAFDEFELEQDFNWINYLANNSCIIIDDVEELKENSPKLYKILKGQKINRFIAVPLYMVGRLVGYILADNYLPKEIEETRIIMENVGTFIARKIVTHKLLSKMDNLSNHDSLTGVKNRNAYMNEIKEITLRCMKVGVIFVDLNGLKNINDNLGHDEGDRFIIKATNFLCDLYDKETVFRLGGDEFVVIFKNINEADFEHQKIRMEMAFKENEDVDFSYGAAWTEDSDNFIETANEADKAMYKCKEAYYSNHERRRSRIYNNQL
ncbi:diguanylate cyclase (GGDEF) domain-containing protein [Acetitomaculum ruminis DSM 5522]|uniref:Diguanylate cyclase (GGDEF) domain-containing protein n=1 Tax=Acetitomaculum ruminis DSM 5522 TaxID=1120918 RepID=A0A1I0XAD5_9FIRM|nr:EAL domain-containing protein [Acetitomaculum ruminis]SFA96893.1 diguanylate cyclase (GGDEF) domain-containing protein [Acetitomaculum ruminis DSM 5522]